MSRCAWCATLTACFCSESGDRFCFKTIPSFSVHISCIFLYDLTNSASKLLFCKPFQTAVNVRSFSDSNRTCSKLMECGTEEKITKFKYSSEFIVLVEFVAVRRERQSMYSVESLSMLALNSLFTATSSGYILLVIPGGTTKIVVFPSCRSYFT